MYGFINKILGVIMCFIIIVLMLSAVMVSEQLQARRSIAAEVTNFVDEVTDTGVLNEKHVADLYLACSAYGTHSRDHIQGISPPLQQRGCLQSGIVPSSLSKWVRMPQVRLRGILSNPRS